MGVQHLYLGIERHPLKGVLSRNLNIQIEQIGPRRHGAGVLRIIRRWGTVPFAGLSTDVKNVAHDTFGFDWL